MTILHRPLMIPNCLVQKAKASFQPFTAYGATRHKSMLSVKTLTGIS